MLVSSEQSTPKASVGVGNPYPVSNYKCKDGTHLAVRLLGDRASVSVNGATEVELPPMGPEGTTFSNGRQTLSIVQGHLSWALAGPCRPHAPAAERLVLRNFDCFFNSIDASELAFTT
ncbi:hypothetical protein GF108_14455 [Phyllobacterium sp. SYP-B3895]|uniref:hypothetical protein n=1 Tax=Phyllobacterium sp. SYP-B3895 TaxID=2663240 RepID=UPI001299BCF9|nr:hypothetical protein [Phyllobacterium sp. SYP-B3895]MRG56778.1 hypothetical protein [Phyllobacterium sp. SYP-B3895]